jgi:hypothetical protein
MCQGLALLTRSFGQRGFEQPRDTFTVPEGRKQQTVSAGVESEPVVAPLSTSHCLAALPR